MSYDISYDICKRETIEDGLMAEKETNTNK